jgi:hypothetical protein
MFRIAILTTALAAVAGAAVSAQPFPRFPPPSPSPAAPAVNPYNLAGRWYNSGDPLKPCYVQVIPGPLGPYLLLTNEKGTPSRARLIRGGTRLVADDWGGLVGRIRGDRIVWPDGNDWTR